MRKFCQAHVEKTGCRCQKSAMRGSRYCFSHQSWGVNVLGAIATLIFGAFLGAVLGPPTQALWEKHFPSESTTLLREISTDKPSLELFLNDAKISTNTLTVIPVPKSGEIEITVSNVGKGTADQIMVDFFTPKPCTNVVTSGQWQQQIPSVDEQNGRLVKDENWLHWTFISDIAIPGGGQKLVIPPIYLHPSGSERFIRVVIGTSAKYTDLMKNSVMLDMGTNRDWR